MSKSIVFSHPSAEVASVKYWNNFAELSTTRQRVTELYLKDPIKDARFGFYITSVYGFLETNGKAHLVYFWCRELISYSNDNPEEKAKVESLLDFGNDLASMWDKEPNLSAALDVSRQKSTEWFKELCGNANLFWKKQGELTFCCIVDLLNTVDGRQVAPPDADIDDCLSFHCDYFCTKSAVWSTIPLRYLLDNSADASKTALGILIHPRLFNPFRSDRGAHFTWPWQDCILNSANCLQHNSVQTTSLVFDLRKSTLAMEAADDIANYSPFIELVVATARECIFDFGGYFDKETGDGIVAHFSNFSGLGLSDDVEPAQMRALAAAVVLQRKVAEICEDFQSGLDDWIDNLGGAVGLHVGQAVWTIRDGNAQAIGSSVVKAARLCAEAQVNHIFVSNAFFNLISKQIRAESVSKFERQSYIGKENGNVAQKSGFSINFKDVFL